MKTFFIQLLFVSLLAAAVPLAHAQPGGTQCIANIQKRLDALGNQTDFDFLQARQIVRDFDFGKINEFATSPNKRAAFQRVWTSLSEFCDAAGNSLSAKGMRGYTKQSGLLINSSDLTKTEGNIAKLKEAFTHGGNFKGTDFDGVMAKLGDSTKFDFDGATGTFTSKASGAKYAKHPTTGYTQGEPDSVTHIIRGHTTNVYTDSLPPGQKSLFFDSANDADLTTKVLGFIDDAMQMPASNRNWVNGNSFWVELGQTVGSSQAGTATTKIRIVRRGGTSDVIHTAFPH